MTVRFPNTSTAAALVARLQHRIDALLRDFADDLDDVLQEQYRAMLKTTRAQRGRRMNADRQRLPNRRHSESFGFECNRLRYTGTASWFDGGRLAEIFLCNHRADSHADACAKDAAILASIALQYGAPLDVLRRALLRDTQGRPSTPIGCALDLLANGETT